MTLQRAVCTLGALLVASTVAAHALTAPPSPEGTSFDELYEKGQRLNASIKTLTAHFVETSTSSLLTRPIVASGTLAVIRPSQVVLHYSEPDRRTLLIDRNRMTLAWPSHSLRQVTDIGATQGRIQKYFVNGSVTDLKHEFEINEFSVADRRGTYHASMTPKRKQIKEALAHIDLWVDEASLLLVELRLTFANGDTKELTFDDVVPNAVIDPAVFTADR